MGLRRRKEEEEEEEKIGIENEVRRVAAIFFAVLGASENCWTQLSEHMADVGRMAS